MTGVPVVSRSQAVCPGCRKYVSKAEVQLGTCGRCGLNFNPGGTDGEVKSEGKDTGEAKARAEETAAPGPAAADRGTGSGGADGGGNPAPVAAAATGPEDQRVSAGRRGWWW